MIELHEIGKMRAAQIVEVFGISENTLFKWMCRFRLDGMHQAADSLDTMGYFVYHQKDFRRVFGILGVHGRDYPFSHAALSGPDRQANPMDSPWRIALVHPHPWGQADRYAREALLAGVGSMATFSEEVQKQEQVSPVIRDLIQRGRSNSLDAINHVRSPQETLSGLMDAFFQDVDFLVTLCTAGEAPLRGGAEIDDLPLMGLPVVSAPVFMSLGAFLLAFSLWLGATTIYCFSALLTILLALGSYPNARPVCRRVLLFPSA